MVRQTEGVYRAVPGFYLNVFHDNLDKLLDWDRNSGTKALEKLTVRTGPRTSRKTSLRFHVTDTQAIIQFLFQELPTTFS